MRIIGEKSMETILLLTAAAFAAIHLLVLVSETKENVIFNLRDKRKTTKFIHKKVS